VIEALLFYALVAATAVVATLTFLPVWRNDAWWVRVQDFPRLQIWIFSIALIGLQLSLLDLSQAATWGLLFFAGLCFSYQAWWIVPYTPLFSKEVRRAADTDPQRTIRFMTANVLTPNRNAQALLDLVREHRPDVLVTLESDHWWQERLDRLENDYPHTIKCALDNLYGMHVYSRLPLADSRIDYLVEPDKPSIADRADLSGPRDRPGKRP
jgi:endonuclease/exonuclease/phosphatase (EEP) superfamily protein YafD